MHYTFLREKAEITINEFLTIFDTNMEDVFVFPYVTLSKTVL